MGDVSRNWTIVGLTPDNRVLKRVNGSEYATDDRPSDYWGVEYLTPAEYAILRRGLTPAGSDRKEPRCV